MAWSSSDLDYMSLIAEANSSVAAAADETTASVPAAADETTASVAVRVPKPRGKTSGKMIIELILAGGDIDYCDAKLRERPHSFSDTTVSDAIAMYHPDYKGRHRLKHLGFPELEKARAARRKAEEEEKSSSSAAAAADESTSAAADDCDEEIMYSAAPAAEDVPLPYFARLD